MVCRRKERHPDELMASLFEAIVLQNLSVLTRGHTLRPHVLLLGGPNTFIRGMREAWQVNIPRMWKDRKVEVPEGSTPQELIKVPQNAQYFAALGAVEYGKTEDDEVGRYSRRRQAGPLYRFRAHRGESVVRRRRAGRVPRRSGGLPGVVPPQEIRASRFSERDYSWRLCRRGRRIHFHQGRAAL